jgi:hypothetical protein
MNYFEGQGKAEAERIESIRNVVFSASKFNAVCTAQSKKSADAIKRHRFPWEKSKIPKNPPTYGQLLPMLKAVFKNNNEQKT